MPSAAAEWADTVRVGLRDTSVSANGTLNSIRSYQGLATLEWHG